MRKVTGQTENNKQTPPDFSKFTSKWGQDLPHLRDLACAKPTLDDVGDHERGTGVVADEPTAGQVAFDLQSKQVPGERENREDKRGLGLGRGGHWKLLKAIPSQLTANICTQAHMACRRAAAFKWALPITIERTAPLQQS